MHRCHWLLLAVSALLAVHALAMGRVLPSSFFIVAFCWMWMGVAAATDRLDAAKSMAATMVTLLTCVALAIKLTPFGQGDLTPFFSLALFPSLVSWLCAYIYIRHIERGDTAKSPPAAASPIRRAWGLVSPRRPLAGEEFVQLMSCAVDHDNLVAGSGGVRAVTGRGARQNLAASGGRR